MPYQHLTAQDRGVIAHLIAQGQGPREIGRQLKRSPGTITRELSRNVSSGDSYEASFAQQAAAARRFKANAKRAKLEANKPLLKAVKDGLNQKWSPKLISERLKQQKASGGTSGGLSEGTSGGDGKGLRVSGPTIYAWLKRDKAQGGRWEKKLPRGGRGRKPNGTKGKRRDPIAGRRCITERPAGAENRSRYGHWEGDTVEGAHKRSFLVTLVDRKSRYGLIGKALNKSSATTNALIRQMLGRLPERLRRTATLDNGTEFSGFAELEEKLEMDLYFAHPYSPWERGSNEQFNGLLRMFLPKGTDFRHVSEQRLAGIEALLNNRPRKCLNYRTPAEVFKPPRGVALRN